MRLLRLSFVVLLAVLLIGVALANRHPVTLSALPGNFGQYLGGTWSVQVPLFLVILLSVMVGIVLGLVWEWLRESGMRAESTRRAHEIALLEREAGTLRRNFAAPKDEVLAILDAPKPTAKPAPGAASSAPALPPAR